MIKKGFRRTLTLHRRIAVALALPQSLARQEITCALPDWTGDHHTPESIRLVRLRASIDLTHILDDIITEKYGLPVYAYTV